MRGTEPIKIEEPFEGDYKVYYVNGGRCSGKVDKIINELVDCVNELQQENKKYKEVIEKAINFIDYNTKYRNGADIYQFLDIESEILEPLKFILELDEENGNAYLKEFKDWLNEVK